MKIYIELTAEMVHSMYRSLRHPLTLQTYAEKIFMSGWEQHLKHSEGASKRRKFNKEARRKIEEAEKAKMSPSPLQPTAQPEVTSEEITDLSELGL